MATSVRPTSTLCEHDQQFTEEQAVLHQLWSAMNHSDRLYSLWFLALGFAILLAPHPIEHRERYLALHAGIIAAISLLTCHQARNRHWRFWHDWYPLLVFIIAFEETARLSFLFRHHWQDRLILDLESRIFSVPPSVWMQRFASRGFTELMEIGYFSFYLFLLLVAGTLYHRAHSSRFPVSTRIESGRAFRDLIDASVLGFIVCYFFYLFFPTESPARALAHTSPAQVPGGLFHWLVNLIQHHGGVHGNAFPSGHIMSATVTLLFAFRYTRRLAWTLLPLFFLMCAGSVYDRYHYFSDVAAGLLIGTAIALPFLRLKPL